MGEKVAVDERRLRLSDDHASFSQSGGNVAIEGSFEKTDGKIDGIGAVDDNRIKGGGMVFDELQGIHGEHFYALIPESFTDGGEEIQRGFNHLFVDIDKVDLFNAIMLHDLSNASSISPTDDENLSRIRMG